LEGRFVEEVDSPDQGLEGREGKGDFLFEVSGDPLGGEKDSAGEGGVSKRGKDFFPLEGDFVGDDSILDAKGPRDNVVEPPAAAWEIILETVNVPLVDRATDRRVCSIEDRYGDGQGEKEESLCLGREDGCEAWREGGDVCVGKQEDVLVGAESEEIGDRGVRFNEHEGYLRDIEREKLGAK
jgi:hypothetical protein